jgi:hypothetical protein
MKISSRLIALIVLLNLLGGIGCEPEPKPQETPSTGESPESPPVIDRGEDGLGTISEDGENVNDLNGIVGHVPSHFLLPVSRNFSASIENFGTTTAKIIHHRCMATLSKKELAYFIHEQKQHVG